jgi:hypothetical protein
MRGIAKLVLPDRIELSTSPLPRAKAKVRNPYLTGISFIDIFRARILHKPA